MDKLIQYKSKIGVFLFFAAYLVLGSAIYRDYGISWDEKFSIERGEMSIGYALRGDKRLLESPLKYDEIRAMERGEILSSDAKREIIRLHNSLLKYYGAVFDIALIAMEAVPGLADNSRERFMTRHLATFLVFYSGVWFFYLLCFRKFGSRLTGLLGCLFLILSPRIFADSFYNMKDAVFLSFFIISVYTMLRFLDRKTALNASIHALTSALLIDVRVLGVMVPFLTLLFASYEMLANMEKPERVMIAKNMLVYLLLLTGFTVLFWPYLWSSPVNNFKEAFLIMSRNPRFLSDQNIIYMGRYIKPSELPWHYIPVWVLITTPPLYSVFFTAGCFENIKSFIPNPGAFFAKRRDDMIFLSWFFIPVITVIVIKAHLYTGWRQLFFIYPAFLITALSGMLYLFAYLNDNLRGIYRKGAIITLVCVVSLGLVNTAWYMIKYHPFQNVYFNMFVGQNRKDLPERFELDYWGLSYRQALEYILKNDNDGKINVFVANLPGITNYNILLPSDQKRLLFTGDPREAKYVCYNYWLQNDPRKYIYNKEEYYSIVVDGAKIMTVDKTINNK